jgi:hypothetical protein
MLVFQGDKDKIARWERHYILKYLSLICVILGSQVENVKKQIQQLIASTERKVKQAEQSMLSQSQNQNLWKTSVKWNLQALVSAMMFFVFFKNTYWLRRKRKHSKKEKL